MIFKAFGIDAIKRNVVPQENVVISEKNSPRIVLEHTSIDVSNEIRVFNVDFYKSSLCITLLFRGTVANARRPGIKLQDEKRDGHFF